MFIKLTYGDNLEHLFNINVTNNILLDYVKTYTKEQMLEQINEKQNIANSTLGELGQDLERKIKIEGEVENLEDESDDIKEIRSSIQQWEDYMKQNITPYLTVLNNRGLMVDFQGDAVLNLSGNPKQYAKESGLVSKQTVQLVYKVEKEGEWQALTYSIKSPDDIKRENEAAAVDAGAEDGA
jgi:hypothetical protein